VKQQIKLPKGESIWVSYLSDSDEVTYIITSKIMRDAYWLYSVDNNGNLEKLKQSQNAGELEKFVKM
jgi:hypothetical protein